MTGYDKIPGINEANQFPPSVREGIAASLEIKALFDEASKRVDGVRNLREFSGANPSQKIHNAISIMGASKTDSILQISDNLVLTEPIYPDLRYVSIDFTGCTVDASAITNGPAIQPKNTSASITGMNRHFIRNLVLKGPGKTVANSTAFRFYSEDPAKIQNIRGTLYENIEIHNFGKATSMGKNSYLLKFFNTHFYQCGTDFHVEDKDDPTVGANSNYGENYQFFGCGFGSSDLAIYMGTNDLTDVHMYGCSFDFNKKMAHVETGQLHLYGAHMEFDGVIPGPIITVGTHGSAHVNIQGGRLQHNNTVSSNVPYWFESMNTFWSGGIHLSNVQFHYIFATSGFLCNGPGNFSTSNTSFPSGLNGSGYAMGTVLTSRANNRLFDPLFAQATHIDAMVSVSSSITSAVASADVDITNVGGKLVLTKKTVGVGSEVSLYIPVQRDRFYASGFMLESHTGSGTMSQNEQFAAVRGSESFDRPKLLKTFSRGAATWNVTELVGVLKSFGPAYTGGAAAWNRQAPPWATHFVVRMAVTNLAVGTYTFSEVVITDI